MKTIKFRAILFDLDGTLLDTLEDLANSMNVVLSIHGMKTFPVDDYRYFVGKGLGELIRSVLPDNKVSDERVEEFLVEMRKEYTERWAFFGTTDVKMVADQV